MIPAVGLRFFTALAAAALAFPLAHAQLAPSATPLAPQSQHAQPDERALQSHDHYRNKDGTQVHSPAKSVSDAVPAGASAKCRDGTWSFSLHPRGTCSHHGGVSQWR